MLDFPGIIGQYKIKNGLIDALRKNKTSHAYIFSGPYGVGKKTLAYAFAGALLCSNCEDENMCGSCLSCNTFMQGTNPDYMEIASDKASISIEAIRAMQRDLLNRPVYGDKKVYIIVDAEKMTVQAQNCLLKTLEEPPGYAVIILTASRYDMLLETIRSRAVKLSFDRYTDREMNLILSSRLRCHGENSGFIVEYADGLPGRAIEILEDERVGDIRQHVFDFVFCKRNEMTQKGMDFHSFIEKNSDSIDFILDMLLMTYRDILMVRSGLQKKLINCDKKDIIVGNADRYGYSQLMTKIGEIENTRRLLKFNANTQLAMDVLQMNLQED